jgi:hypothetical protein
VDSALGYGFEEAGSNSRKKMKYFDYNFKKFVSFLDLIYIYHVLKGENTGFFSQKLTTFS